MLLKLEFMSMRDMNKVKTEDDDWWVWLLQGDEIVLNPAIISHPYPLSHLNTANEAA